MGYDQMQFSFPRQQTDWYNPTNAPWNNITFGDDDEEDTQDEYGLGPMGASPYIAQMNKLMSQPMPAYDKYLASVANVPRREQYEPNKWTKIAAMLGGFSQGIKGDIGGAISTGQAIRNLPYQQAYDDWNRNNQALEAIAKQEYVNRKQSAEDLLKMADNEVKTKTANAGAARAKASLSTAATYDRQESRPSWHFYSDADTSGLYDSKTANTQKLGQSPNAAMRLFQGKQNSLDRDVRVSEGRLDREAAQRRAETVGKRKPFRKTITKTITAKEGIMHDQRAMREAMQAPEVTAGAKRFIKYDKNTDSYVLVPPSPSDTPGMESYKQLQNWLKIRKENNIKETVTVPYGYESGGFQNWYDPEL